MVLTEEEIYRRVEDLPAISNAAIELINIIDYPETTREDIVKLLIIDETLLAQAIKVANSAAYGSRREIIRIKDIVDILGFEAIKDIAMYIAGKSIFNDEDIWFESVFIATAAKKIARKLNWSMSYCDTIYMAALFQYYGVLCFKMLYPQEYQPILEESNYMLKLEKEKELFGINHLKLSAEILRQWNFPEKVTAIIKNQEDLLYEALNEQNTIIELARFLLGHEYSDNWELHEALEEHHNLSFLTEKYRINTGDIDIDFVKSIFEESYKMISL